MLEDDFFLLEIYENELHVLTLKIGHIFFILEIHYLLIKKLILQIFFINIRNLF